MRKAIATLLVFLLLAGVAGYAEAALIDYDFGDFTVSLPEDTDVYFEDQIVSNVPFAYFYQDYNENAVFNKNLNILWTDEVLDLNTIEPTSFAQHLMEATVDQYDQMGLAPTNASLLIADFDEQDGKQGFSYMYTVTLDYTAYGSAEQIMLYVLQAMVPDEAFGGTYTLTQHAANDVLYDLTLDSETGTALVGVTEYTDAAGGKSSEYTLILSLPEQTVYFRADMAQ